jgi:hypothetical protein
MASKDSSIIREEVFPPSTMETIDEAFFKYVDEKLNLHVMHREGFKKVPVIWQSAERAFHRKTHLDIRASTGELKLPIISVFRSEVTKDPARKGGLQANIPPYNDVQGGVVTITKRINQEKTSNFANAMAKRVEGQNNWPFHNNQVVYQTVDIPLPVYVNINYQVNIKTQYLQHINDLITPFITRQGQINYFIFGSESHRYEAFVDSAFNLESNASDVGGEEKTYQTQINVNVLGYLIGDGPNQEQPKLVYRENAVRLIFGRESIWPRSNVPNTGPLPDGSTQDYPGPILGVVGGEEPPPIVEPLSSEADLAGANSFWHTLSLGDQERALEAFHGLHPSATSAPMAVQAHPGLWVQYLLDVQEGLGALGA